MDKLLARLRLLIPDIFLAVLLASSISFALTTSILLKVSYINILLSTIVATFILIFIFWNTLSFLVCVSTISSGLVIFISFFDKYSLTSKTVFYVGDSFLRVYDYIFAEGNIQGLENQISVFISALIAIFIFLIIIKLKAYSFAILSGGVFFAIQSILGYLVSITPFYIFLVTIIFLYFYDVNYQKHKNLELKGRSGILFITSVIPIVVIIFLSTVYMPFSNEPIQLPWLDKKVIQLSDYIINSYDDYKGKNDFFSLARTGFGREGKLGGSVEADNAEVLQVWTSKPTYLKAIGRDIYNGSAWKDSFKEQKDILDPQGYIADEFYEMNFGLKLLNRQNQGTYKDFFNINKYEIKFLDLKTKSLFIPSGFMAMGTQDIKASADYNISTSMEKIKKRDFKYEIIVQTPRFESSSFIKALSSSYDGLYKDQINRNRSISWQWDDRVQVPGSFSMPTFNKDIKLADYAQKADRIRSTYTVLPKILPQRVIDLAVKVTEGQRTNYGKAKSIEKYLSENFPYTLQPGETPKEKDFVDYFLFEQKQGYCVHYATSMAVMARAVGLPSRYVEGYMMPNSKNSDESYIVTNQNAHSWVEIYFEGAGWVQFEPTAAFNQDFYRQDENNAPSSGENGFNDEETTPGPEELTTEDEIAPNINVQGSGIKILNIIRNVSIFILISVVIVLLMVVISTEKYRYKIRKYKKLPPSKAMVKLYEELLRIMKKLGYDILDNETAIQYGMRIDGLFYIRPVSFEELSIDFTEARYGGRQIDVSKLEGYDKVYSRLLEIFKKEKGKFRYLIEHYLLGTI